MRRLSRRLGVSHWRNCTLAMQSWHVHSEHERERVRRVRFRHLSACERRDGLCRLSSGESLPRACTHTDTVQPWLSRRSNGPRELFPVRRWQLSEQQ